MTGAWQRASAKVARLWSEYEQIAERIMIMISCILLLQLDLGREIVSFMSFTPLHDGLFVCNKGVAY